MLSLNLLTAASAALTLVAAAPIQQRGVPSGWATSYLESYDVYHERYIALSCQNAHNTSFFEDCCHPLLAKEELSSRPDYCTPNATEIASASSVIAYSATVSATATATTTADSEEESEYCSDEASVASAVSSVVAAATGTVSQVVITSAEATQTIDVVNQVVASTSSSEHSEPKTTSTSEYVAPSTTSSSTPAATSTASSSGSANQGGYATYFYQGGVAGECGTVHSDSDYIVAIDAAGWWSDYESNSNSPYCGKSLTITNTNNGKSVTATVADVCPTCTNDNSLDLSVAAFTAIASESDGMVPISWVWN